MSFEQGMRFVAVVLVCGVVGLSALPAAAQVTPSDVADLVGARAAGGESELASRGYINVGGRSGADRKWTYWWNDRRGVCLSVATVEGRYDSLVASPSAECQQGNAPGDNRQDRPQEFGYGPPSRNDYREHIALICYGESQKMTTQTQSGYEWDSSKRKYVSKSGFETTNQDFSTSVTVEIDGDRGRIRPAKDMLPLVHSGSEGGWYDISGLTVSRDMIRGDFKINAMNRPKLSIDRRAGHITVDGLTKFNGNCTPLDGDRKF